MRPDPAKHQPKISLQKETSSFQTDFTLLSFHVLFGAERGTYTLALKLYLIALML